MSVTKGLTRRPTFSSFLALLVCCSRGWRVCVCVCGWLF